jgi:cholesterol transport system auxiliary component
MTSPSPAVLGRLCAFGLLLTLLGGCSALRSTGTPQPSFYSLDSARIESGPARQASAPSPVAAPTLIVSPPQAAAGFDSQRLIYVRAAHKLDYFAHSEWVDTPARMLAPLLVSALESGGTFRAVILAPTAAAGDLRLDTEILRLQQDFASQPSRVRFTLRAYLVDNTTRRVLAWRVFDESVVAASDDPYGGVVAANRALHSVLGELAGFCATAAAPWPPAAAAVPQRLLKPTP